MRDLVVTENITLDGVIDAGEGWFGPSGPDSAETDDMAAAQAEQRDGADAVLLGRTTYQEFESYWPKQTDDRTGIAEYLNRTRKYVVSATLRDLAWANSTVLRGPMLEEVAALKALPGKQIVATGSVTLVRALARAGLVAEYRLFVYPVVLGRGRRLFEDVAAMTRLALVESTAFRSGIVLMRYRAA